MWWGDDGTLNDAVSKGTIADDALFREAEKHGIDIRKKRVEENALAAQVRVKKEEMIRGEYSTVQYSTVQ